MTKPGPASALNDQLKAIETVDDLIGVYMAQAASLEAQVATDYEGRKDLENSIAGMRETAERLRHVRQVLAAGRKKRARRSPKT